MSEILPGENPLFWQQFFTEFCRQKNDKKITDGRDGALLALLLTTPLFNFTVRALKINLSKIQQWFESF